MIHEAEEQISHIPDDVLLFHPNLKLPLMRLAVDFSNPHAAPFPQPNLTRFGQQYMDVIANSAELLRPIKPKPIRAPLHHHSTASSKDNRHTNDNSGGGGDFWFPIAPQLSTMDIRSKVAEVFQSNAKDACTLLS
uniref:Double-strand break repair protein MRE11 n=1 Tax=Lygus hesperus TaxID=30085 RepID=A0A0A9YT77_LYGHE